MGLDSLATGVTGLRYSAGHELPELAGEVDPETGDIVLDTTNLDAISRRLKDVRKQKNKYAAEDKRLTDLVRGHKDSKVGYSNAALLIVGADDINLTDKRLIKVLEDESLYQECLQTPKLSVAKVRSVAKENDKIAKALKKATGQVRKIKMTTVT